MSSGDVAIKLVIYVAAGVATLVFGLLGWLGKRVLENKEQAADRRDDQIETLRTEIREIKRQMGEDHGDVEDLVQRLDDKLDQTHDMLQDLQ